MKNAKHVGLKSPLGRRQSLQKGSLFHFLHSRIWKEHHKDGCLSTNDALPVTQKNINRFPPTLFQFI